MSTTEPTTTSTVQPPLNDLAAQLHGRLIRPGDDSYDEARRVWNGMFDRRPLAIAQCADSDDVIAGVTFARQQGLVVSVRGGAHSWPGYSTTDGGLVIDLAPMKAITVDATARTVRAEGGVKWGELDRATQEHGLAVTGGTNSDTGIAGLTLGGGIGWLQRAFGLSCDNLLAADVVSADGRLMRASADDHADLFWGLRGGGGNFGIVTAFEYRLHPVGPVVLAGPILYPLEQAREVLAFQRSFMPTAPDELMVFDLFLTVPPAPPFPEALYGQKLLFVVPLYVGPVDEGERVAAPLRQIGQPIADAVQPMPYTVLQTTLDDALPRGIRAWSSLSYLRQLDDAAIDLMAERFRGVPSPHSHVVIGRMDGAVTRVPQDATAFPQRAEQYVTWIVAGWPDETGDEANIKWARDFKAAIQPFATGSTYVNAQSDESVDPMQSGYVPGTYERLTDLKRKYDPTNLFRLNQNIMP